MALTTSQIETTRLRDEDYKLTDGSGTVSTLNAAKPQNLLESVCPQITLLKNRMLSDEPLDLTKKCCA